jgi:solute carrier family 25 (mitochondrial carnitine/acylcarnitine transporter), member 20/29
MYLIMSPVLW